MHTRYTTEKLEKPTPNHYIHRVREREKRMAKINVPVEFLSDYAEYIKTDYIKWWGPRASEKHVQEMIAERGIEFQPGSSYIKVVETRNGVVERVHSFIANKDTKKYLAGTILKAASFKAPATNFGRAHLYHRDSWEGHVSWTGAN